MGYRPPIGKPPANPYANAGPANPFAQEASAISPAMGAVETSPMQRVKPGFNDAGGLGGKLGQLGDFLLSVSGNEAGMIGMRNRNDLAQQQSAFERGEQTYQRNRRDTVADDERNFGQQMKLAADKRANPETTSMQRNYEFLKGRGGNLGDAYLQNQSNPPRFGIVNGMPAMIGGYQGSQTSNEPSADDVKGLLSGTGSDAQFDEIYGQGSASRARGGAGPQTPRGFR